MASRNHTQQASDSRALVAAKLRDRSRLERKNAKPEVVSHEKARLLQAIRRDHPGASSQAQRERILMAFAVAKTVTTLECRLFLDIAAPGARICELRKHGKNIVTTLVRQEPFPGVPHLFAKYVLAKRGA